MDRNTRVNASLAVTVSWRSGGEYLQSTAAKDEAADQRQAIAARHATPAIRPSCNFIFSPPRLAPRLATLSLRAAQSNPAARLKFRHAILEVRRDGARAPAAFASTRRVLWSTASGPSSDNRAERPRQDS